jgi:hypothetical protein
MGIDPAVEGGRLASKWSSEDRSTAEGKSVDGGPVGGGLAAGGDSGGEEESGGRVKQRRPRVSRGIGGRKEENGSGLGLKIFFLQYINSNFGDILCYINSIILAIYESDQHKILSNLKNCPFHFTYLYQLNTGRNRSIPLFWSILNTRMKPTHSSGMEP